MTDDLSGTVLIYNHLEGCGSQLHATIKNPLLSNTKYIVFDVKDLKRKGFYQVSDKC